MRDRPPAVDPTTHRALHTPGRLIDRVVDVRVYVLYHGVIDPVQYDAHRASTFAAVLGPVHILKQDVHPLDAVCKVSDRTEQFLARMAIDVFTVIQVQAADFKPHG